MMNCKNDRHALCVTDCELAVLTTEEFNNLLRH